MKVLFLDFDGVLVTLASIRSGSGRRAMGDPAAVRALNRVVEATGAWIVVSSTWRIHSTRTKLQEILTEWGVRGRVLGRTPDLARPAQTALAELARASGGVTTAEQRQLLVATGRGNEIQAWLDEYEHAGSRHGEVESFVILDDEDDMRHLQFRLVQSQFDTGLTEELADRAIAMLGEMAR